MVTLRAPNVSSGFLLLPSASREFSKRNTLNPRIEVARSDLFATTIRSSAGPRCASERHSCFYAVLCCISICNHRNTSGSEATHSAQPVTPTPTRSAGNEGPNVDVFRSSRFFGRGRCRRLGTRASRARTRLAKNVDMDDWCAASPAVMPPWGKSALTGDSRRVRCRCPSKIAAENRSREVGWALLDTRAFAQVPTR